MNIGLTIKKIKTEIRSIASAQPDIQAVFGFGSFFRGEPYNDLDLLVVTRKDCKDPLTIYYRVNETLRDFENEFDIEIDMTFLTFAEYLERPLLEMDTLTPIYE